MATVVSKEDWIPFFESAGFSPPEANHFAALFFEHKMREAVLPKLTIDFLQAMGISAIGDVILILERCQAGLGTVNEAASSPAAAIAGFVRADRGAAFGSASPAHQATVLVKAVVMQDVPVVVETSPVPVRLVISDAQSLSDSSTDLPQFVATSAAFGACSGLSQESARRLAMPLLQQSRISLPQTSFMQTFVETIDGKKRFTCQYCPHVVETRSGMCRHETIHHKPGRYRCDVSSTCDLTFTSQRHLSEHFRLAHLNATLSCGVCSKEYSISKRKDFLVHKRSHLPNYLKPFSCKYCVQRFNQQIHLLRHIAAKHVNEKSFACARCLKRYFHPDTLTRHISLKH